MKTCLVITGTNYFVKRYSSMSDFFQEKFSKRVAGKCKHCFKSLGGRSKLAKYCSDKCKRLQYKLVDKQSDASKE